MPSRMRPYVELATAYEFRGFAPGKHAGLPSRHLTVVISLDEPIDMIAMPDRSHRPTALGALAGGLHAAPVIIRHDGTQVGLHLHITPLGSRALFGMPAAELAWQVVPLAEVFGAAGELIERLRSTLSWTQRFAVLDEVLGRALDEMVPEMRPEVTQALRRLVDSAGSVEVGSLSREVGWSRRHLTAQFGAELGLTPKVVARVLRFQGAVRRLSRGGASLAEVAAACGYADQAHMTRDWNDFAGCSPAAWLAAEQFSNVQDELVLAS